MAVESLERVQRAIHFEDPDRIPIKHHTLIGAWNRYGDRLREVYGRYPADMVFLTFKSSDEYGPAPREGVRDEWGALWVRLGDDFKGQVVDHPLGRWGALDSYTFPDPAQTEEYDRVKDLLAREGHDKYVLVDAGTLFQRMFYLRGFEELLVDLVAGDDRIMILRDRIMEHILGRIHHWLDAGVDGIQIRDDWGAQDRLLISPGLWRNVFKPCYKQICEAIHAGGANAHIHTDGYTIQIIPDLMEVGFDEINPQMTVIGLENLAGVVRGRVCIRTDIDRQRLLPFGKPAEVEENVKRTIEVLATREGGLVGDGEVGGDVPLENVEAMLRAFKKHGAIRERGAPG
jgi:hypothetical protein